MRRKVDSRREHQTAYRPKSAARQSLAGALFTSTQQRMLALFFGQPDRTFFTREIFDLARSGRGAVQRELARLADAGLLVVTKVGNQKHFQANRAAPIFDELHGIVLKTVGLFDPIKAALRRISEQTQLALIYGSVAKRADTVSSDVDLLVVSQTLSLEDTYGAMASAEKVIGRKISITLLTPQELRQRQADKSPFLMKVLSDQHIVLIGEAPGNSSAGQPCSDSTAKD